MRKWIAMVALAIVASACIVQAGERLKIGLALPTQQEERWVRDMHAMQAEAEKQNIDLRVLIARNDQAQQNSQVEQLLSQGIKVLIIAPHDGEGAAVAVRKCHEDGVRVISYDRLIMGTDVDVYMSFDNVAVGELQGKWISNKVPKGDYILMSGAPTDNNAKLFQQGNLNILQPLIDKGDIKVIVNQPVIDWQPSNAQKIVENALTLSNNKVDAVLAPNDGCAGGAIAALEAQGLAGKIPVTGMDADGSAAQRIVRSLQSMTVFKDTRWLGEEAVKLAILMAKGEDIIPYTKGQVVNNDFMDVPSVLLEAVAVDKDNIDEVLIDSDYLKREDVYQ
ncbi:MAG: substrate-binding domain-containing protein [Planctomycetota bacterium]|jgi:D-xylose transport system substrate-binding protein|nr:substrate-binding domain-containing protein [Planctomycetota bacterium]